MARLLLLRHAKSSRDDASRADFDRPLAPRGERDAEHIGRLLVERGLVPDRILCSSAVRTRETLAQIVKHLPGDPQTDYRDDLYNAPTSGYLGVVAANGGTADALIVIGHNPMIQEAALQLIDGSNPGLAAEIGSGYPTGAVAVIDFALSDWRDIRPGAGRVTAFLRPRDTGA